MNKLDIQITKPLTQEKTAGQVADVLSFEGVSNEWSNP